MKMAQRMCFHATKSNHEKWFRILAKEREWEKPAKNAKIFKLNTHLADYEQKLQNKIIPNCSSSERTGERTNERTNGRTNTRHIPFPSI